MNDQPANDFQVNNTQQNSYVDEYVPPVVNDNTVADPAQNSVPAQTEETSTATNSQFDSVADTTEEDLEAQNIFIMLGVDDGSEELKEKFLDQLQEVIWDDFLSNDVQLLLTTAELPEFDRLKSAKDRLEGEAQEKAQDDLVEYLEKFIPDLEDIMLEKALDLKADLFVERIASMKEFFTGKDDKLDIVSEAESLMFEDKWKTAAEKLNEIQE